MAYTATNASWDTVAHEIAHLFYLPDLYDHDGDGVDEPYFRDWDLMEIRRSAVHFNGWSRLKLGWLSTEKVVDVQPGEKTTVILSPIELSDAEKKLIRIPRVTLPETSGRFRAFPPSFSPQRSYFLEARKRTGFDQDLPSDGVLLYTVDEAMSSGGGPLRLVDHLPSTTTLSDAAFAPLPGDRSVFEDATEGLTVSIEHLSDGRFAVEVDYRPPGRVTLNLGLNGSGAATAKTSDGDGVTQAGYVDARLTTGRPPYATAVLSLRQNGVVVSEVGVPASKPTTAARVFVDYRANVRPPGSTGTVAIYTGFAAVNRSSQTATITLTLRDLAGAVLATGVGTLAQGAHMARFVEELGEIFAGFSTPPSFPESIRFGTLELDSDQPIAVVALRLTRNQRGEVLMTTVPVADLTQPLSQSSLFFPQLADGGGFATSVSLMNTSSGVQSGTLRAFRDDGSPLEVRMNGANGTSFRYSIPAGGATVFESDSGPSLTATGWIEITPDASHSAPVGVGLFQYSRDGTLITQSGIPAATATTRARIYVDMSDGHDTGLALANPGIASTEVRLNVFNLDGSAVTTATGTIPLSGHGHSAKFVREIIPNLPNGFRGVVEIRSASPLAVLTIRSLMNTRGDFLLTTFPVADLNATASPPMLFPQIADGGGYQTEFIFLGTGETATLTLDFYGADGRPLPIGK